MLLAFVPLMMLAGCTTATDDPFLNATAPDRNAPALATSVPAQQAIATIPGRVPLAVRQSVRDRVVEQTILYPNPKSAAGENALSITVAAAGADPGGTNAPSRAGIETEMRAALPGIPMRIDPVIGDNAHGAYGTATGPYARSGGCLYAWQVVRRLGESRETGFSGLSRSYSAHLRLRYCDAATSPERLAAMMEGLRIKPVDDRTFQPLQRTTETAVSTPVAPPPVMAPVVAVADAKVAPSRPRKVVRAPKQVAEASPVAVAPQPLSNAVKVPLPGGSVRKAQTVAVATPPAAASPVKVPLPGGNAAP